MGENRKGLAVMRLLARHPNTDGETLARLADKPEAQQIALELAANPKTPTAVLERGYHSTDYIVEWGLALNPKPPQRVMERHAAGNNPHTRLDPTTHKETPGGGPRRRPQDA